MAFRNLAPVVRQAVPVRGDEFLGPPGVSDVADDDLTSYLGWVAVAERVGRPVVDDTARISPELTNVGRGTFESRKAPIEQLEE